MEITDKYKLEALYRALIAAKFCIHPSDELVMHSPLVAELALETLSALEEISNNNSKKTFVSWSDVSEVTPYLGKNQDMVNMRKSLRELGWSPNSIEEHITYLLNSDEFLSRWERILICAHKNVDYIQKCDCETKIRFAKMYIAPFKCTDNDITVLLDTIFEHSDKTSDEFIAYIKSLHF